MSVPISESNGEDSAREAGSDVVGCLYGAVVGEFVVLLEPVLDCGWKEGQGPIRIPPGRIVRTYRNAGN